MWSMILSFLSGPLLGKLVEAYKLKLEAKTQADTLAVDLAAKEIAGEIEQRRTETALIVSEQGRWYTACIRPLFALPFILFAWKVIVWDKVLGHWTNGSTDPLDTNMWSVFLAVVTAYFGGRTIEKVARILKR
jgi:hypothetical protein